MPINTPQTTIKQQSYHSQTWGVEVRQSIADEFTLPEGFVDDNLAGLHEIRVRMWERAGKDMKKLAVMIQQPSAH